MTVRTLAVRGAERGRWRRWSRRVGRFLFAGLVAVGTYNTGVIVPYATYQRAEDVERALWSQLRDVRRLLPLLDAVADGTQRRRTQRRRTR